MMRVIFVDESKKMYLLEATAKELLRGASVPVKAKEYELRKYRVRLVKISGSMLKFVTRNPKTGKEYKQIVQLIEMPKYIKMLKDRKITPMKCVDAILSGNVRVTCSCPSFKYDYRYWATKRGYLFGRPEYREPRVRNTTGYGTVCKHLYMILKHLRDVREPLTVYLQRMLPDIVFRSKKGKKVRVIKKVRKGRSK